LLKKTLVFLPKNDKNRGLGSGDQALVSPQGWNLHYIPDGLMEWWNNGILGIKNG
jgi:hypothetical protein